MAGVKIKKVKVAVGSTDGITDMFNQVLGTGAINLTIAYPRYIRMRDICVDLIELFTMVADSPFMRSHLEFADQRAALQAFCEASKLQITKLFKWDFSDYEWNLLLVEDGQRDAFAVDYEAMKKSELVKCFISMCDRLVAYKKNFSDLNKLSNAFITNMAGCEWCPFPFSNLNLKYIFGLPGVGQNTIKFFMIVLNRAYDMSYRLWNENTTPDIDIDKFVDHIMANLDIIQKRPELSRCQKAFAKIKDSVHLLKDRFNNYYRDFIDTQDNTIIMQHFILDVSKETKVDMATNAQFRTIIAYYREIARDQMDNPKIKMLFDTVNAQFKEIERGHENLVNVRSNSPVDESAPTQTFSSAATPDNNKK